ncbi:MAG TPA: hypothetical protein VGM67_03365 [Gemmatimonadaceae bacterium]|jgi:hypothetical protein
MRSRLVAFLLILAAGCDQPPVDWREPAAIPAPPAGSHLIVDSSGVAKFVEALFHPATLPASDPATCQSSVQTVVGAPHVYAVWWSVRPDSSAVLRYASSADSGKTWGNAAAVDTSDVSSRGCSRPPPSLTAVGDDMYVAYSMIAPEGTGVFFAHTMSSMLHSPVAVIYGDRLVGTSIAAEGAGDRVAVAYEEPNGKREQIELALSTTEGHIFEVHSTATRDVDVATMPSVAIAGPAIAVSWLERPLDATATSRIVRVGRIK